MTKRIFTVLMVVGMSVYAGSDLDVPANKIKHEKEAAVRTDIATLKATDNWVNMTNQLAQYDAHLDELKADIITATNKIELVVDAPTKLALNKIQNEVEDLKRMVDDIHDAVKKMSKVVIDSLKIQEAAN